MKTRIERLVSGGHWQITSDTIGPQEEIVAGQGIWLQKEVVGVRTSVIAAPFTDRSTQLPIAAHRQSTSTGS
jgi:hypothetical protein